MILSLALTFFVGNGSFAVTDYDENFMPPGITVKNVIKMKLLLSK